MDIFNLENLERITYTHQTAHFPTRAAAACLSVYSRSFDKTERPSSPRAKTVSCHIITFGDKTFPDKYTT